MRKFFYKDDIYTEEQLEEIYPQMVNDSLLEGDYDDIMTYADFLKTPEKYLDEYTLEGQILQDICNYLSEQDNQLENDVIPLLYLNNGYSAEDFAEVGICTEEDAKKYITEYLGVDDLEELRELAKNEIKKAGFSNMEKKDFLKLCYLLTTCDPCAYTDDFIRQFGIK